MWKSDVRKQVVVDAGGAASIVAAMRKHGYYENYHSPAVQAKACEALTKLMAGSDVRKQVVVDAGGAASIVAAMRRCSRSEAVQVKACEALRNLMVSDDALSDDALRQVVVAVRGVPDIEAALQHVIALKHSAAAENAQFVMDKLFGELHSAVVELAALHFSDEDLEAQE
eukprot:COSAG02_NODE_27441_length_609_cov_1.415686_1_plen_170_part_10